MLQTYAKLTLMHQSIPAVPIPLGISRIFFHIVPLFVGGGGGGGALDDFDSLGIFISQNRHFLSVTSSRVKTINLQCTRSEKNKNEV